MKRIILIFAAVLTCAFFPACSGKKSDSGERSDTGERLVIYTWSDMFPQEILTGFERETGIRVNYVNFEENEVMFARLKVANGGDFDLIIADDYMLENIITEGLATNLDRQQLPNFGNINPLFQGQFYDPTDEYTIPYGAGVQTIVYDPQLVSVPITGYQDLWNPVFAQRLGIIDHFRVINGMALKVMGESYNTNDLDTIRRAGELLQGLAPNIRLIRYAGMDDEVISGEVSAAVMFTANVTRAMMARPELEVVFPREGIGFGIMGAFIPKAAPNPNAAYAFLTYIMDPERGARCFEALGYYSTFSASDPFISPQYRPFLTLPADIDRDNMEMIQNISPEAEDLHNRVYEEFRFAAGAAR